MVNFNEDLFDTWESACKQISENGFSMYNESNTIVVDKNGSNFENNFNEVIFNGLLEFIKRYKSVK